jgi:glyoxylase-like metal-dependent hydrolase (beta-lactamase superfamily II)
MAEVKILIEGFTNADSADESGEEKTSTTCTLIRDGKLVIVVDPGVLESQNILVDALAKEGLKVEDVNLVIITHSHLDHYRNIGMFPDAKSLEYWALWDGEKADEWHEKFTDDIRIIKTPGHNYDGLTILVNTKDGVVAIAGDVWWKENYPQDDDPYASDMEKLKESRKKVLELADYVIPGHGPMFKISKK